MTRDDGQVIRFPVSGSTIVTLPGVTLRFAVTGSGFTVTDENDSVETYNAAGTLLSITSRAGVVLTMGYDANQRLSGVTDSFGNSPVLTRDATGRLTASAITGGSAAQYGYDASGRLSTVTWSDAQSRTYVYENAGFPNGLTGVVDESSARLLTWAYDSQGRGSSAQLAGGANAASLVYNADGTVTVTDALSAQRTFTYTAVGDFRKPAAISGSQCPTCQESAATTYDAAGFVSSRTDYNGNLTCYANDPARGLELVRVEGFGPGSTCPTNLASYIPAANTSQRKISTQWSTLWREPSLITEATRTTGFTFDGSGNVLTKAITDTSVSLNVSRTWTYTYNGYGQVLSKDGPRTDVSDVTHYSYYNCTTGAQCGQLATVTDALGHVTSYNSYNAFGQPLSITDPNGVGITLGYDARERLTSWQIGPETTHYSYLPIGLLQTVTRPDGSTLSNTYDAAHRLTQVTDGAGNSLVYQLDGLGNHLSETANYPGTPQTYSRVHSWHYNTLGRMDQDIPAAATTAVTTTYGYDGNGNQTTIAAPLTRDTTNVYDALNRKVQVTDPNNGIAHFGYDTEDNLTSVTDPKGFVTTYTRNGFGELIQQVSPDTGTATNTYDSAGNLKTRTDARGATKTYTYDALNRPIQMVALNPEPRPAATTPTR